MPHKHDPIEEVEAVFMLCEGLARVREEGGDERFSCAAEQFVEDVIPLIAEARKAIGRLREDHRWQVAEAVMGEDS